jgi:hypothetical protein
MGALAPRRLPGLLAGSLVSVLALAALPVAPAAADNCHRLKDVKYFHGHFSYANSISASGSDPDSGGTESVGLYDQVDSADVKLHLVEAPDRHHPGPYRFAGPASGGQVSVQDSWENTGTDISGDATYDKALPKKNGGGASLAIFRNECKFTIGAGFTVKPSFSGDLDVKPGRVGAVFDALTGKVGEGVTVEGNDKPGIYEENCVNLPVPACANMETPWYGDLFELWECHSLDTSHCNLQSDQPTGHGRFSWHLKPKYYGK